jgi:stage III sporulation protein AF
MMAAARTWLTGLVVVTMLLSVVQLLLPEGTLRRVGSFTGGLVLLAALVQPLLGTKLEKLEVDMAAYSGAIEARRAELEQGELTEMAALIEARTAAYISQEASRMGLTVEVRVETEPDGDGVPVPAAVEITGGRSQALEAWITEALGIPAERQVYHERNDET